MKSILLSMAVLISFQSAQAAIRCSGYDIAKPNVSVKVVLDGNPLMITMINPSDMYSGISEYLATFISPKEVTSIYQRQGYSTLVSFKAGAKGLPRGTNAQLTEFTKDVRQVTKKREFNLSCTGKLPSVYLQ